jgi:hypothetical protein
MKNGLRGVASLKGGNLVVFYNFCASEIWPDKRGWWVLLKGDYCAVIWP